MRVFSLIKCSSDIKIAIPTKSWYHKTKCATKMTGRLEWGKANDCGECRFFGLIMLCWTLWIKVYIKGTNVRTKGLQEASKQQQFAFDFCARIETIANPKKDVSEWSLVTYTSLTPIKKWVYFKGNATKRQTRIFLVHRLAAIGENWYSSKIISISRWIKSSCLTQIEKYQEPPPSSS